MDNTSNLLKKRGKSFFWASLFFSKKERLNIQTLYSFCRLIDDIGDSNKLSRVDAKKKLNRIIFEIKKNKSENKIVSSFLNLSQNCSINNKIPIELIKGVIKDLRNVNIKTLEELIIYSFQVAGTVGLMMCSIMNVKLHSLQKPALKLGIAMQLTNISRDIKEDLLLNRIYLPSEIRSFKYNNSNELLSNVKKKKKIIK